MQHPSTNPENKLQECQANRLRSIFHMQQVLDDLLVEE